MLTELTMPDDSPENLLRNNIDPNRIKSDIWSNARFGIYWLNRFDFPIPDSVSMANHLIAQAAQE